MLVKKFQNQFLAWPIFNVLQEAVCCFFQNFVTAHFVSIKCFWPSACTAIAHFYLSFQQYSCHIVTPQHTTPHHSLLTNYQPTSHRHKISNTCKDKALLFSLIFLISNFMQFHHDLLIFSFHWFSSFVAVLVRLGKIWQVRKTGCQITRYWLTNGKLHAGEYWNIGINNISKLVSTYHPSHSQSDL